MANRKIKDAERFAEQVRILDIAEDGKGVAKVNDAVVFVEKLIPEDVADIELIRKKRRFFEARPVRIITPSPYRVEAFCPHFGVCGGCKWQHMDYAAQLHFKQKSVYDALTRIGKVDASNMEPILPSAETRYYRNKLEFTFSNKRWLTQQEVDISKAPTSSDAAEDMQALGFHVPGRFDKILPIQHCYLQGNISNELRNRLDSFAKAQGYSYYDLKEHQGQLRNLIIRTASTRETMVIVVFAYADETCVHTVMNYLQAQFPTITSLMYVINQKRNDTIFDLDVHTFGGRDHIFEEMEGLRFKIGPKSFYQTNSQQAYELYKITREFANLQGGERIYDLYTGTGTIAQFVAKQAAQVIGIEYVPSAIEDAKINAQLNGLTNTLFYAGDMKDVLTSEFIAEHGKPDVVITDPPRAGMHPDVVQRLLEMEAPRIVYVSCNAATQARDLEMLSAKYRVDRIKPVDMFPHTQHVENVVSLLLK